MTNIPQSKSEFLNSSPVSGHLPLPLKIAYIMSRFPKITETFVLYEMVAMEEQGAQIELFPLLKERHSVAHPEALRMMSRAHFHPFISWPILRAHWHFIRRAPGRYFRTIGEVLQGTWGSPRLFFGALGIFPKAVRFAQEMEEGRIGHIHCHFATHPAVGGLIVHRLTDIPFSFTAHGSDLHVDRRMLDRKVDAAAFAVTVSQYNKELMVEECGEAARAKIHVVHCGVDAEVFSPEASVAPVSPPAIPAMRTSPLQLITVASFEEVKGHRYLVEACALLAKRGLEFKCHLVGGGPLRSDVEQQINDSGLAGVFCLHGKQPREKVAELMRRADICVLPSVLTSDGRREGIPVALMEAMAAGLPIVSSELSGIPELVEHGKTGLLAPPRNAAALADALELLARDPDMRLRMGKAGREKVLREFNLKDGACRLLDLILAFAHSMPGCRPLSVES